MIVCMVNYVVDTQVANGEQPSVVEPQSPCESQVIEISPSPVGRLVPKRGTGSVRRSSRCDQRAARAATLRDRARLERTFCGGCAVVPRSASQHRSRRGTHHILSRAMFARERPRLRNPSRLHGSRRHGTASHRTFVPGSGVVGSSRPSARRYSATTMGSETRV